MLLSDCSLAKFLVIVSKAEPVKQIIVRNGSLVGKLSAVTLCNF